MGHDNVPHKGALEHPDTIGDGELVGVDSQGKPVYYDPHDNVAFDGVERGDGYEAGDRRGEGPLESVVTAVEDAVGWESLVGDEDTDS